MINIKNSPYNAVGDGFTDDRAAIQRAIDDAKAAALSSNTAVKYRITVYIPAGIYYVAGPLDLTNSNGLWVVGDGGSYLNTNIWGNTGGVIFDFSGSSSSGCENISFFTSDRGNRSTTALLFALTNNGGLNCGVRNCHFDMADNPNANGGFGSMGIVNIRSEEFYVRDCLIRANTPLLFSYRRDLSETGTNYTVSSSVTALSTGEGSMGVVEISGTSLQNIQKRQPALVLLGTNSVSFQGYIGRLYADAGSYETAILCVRYTTNLRVHATIESFSRVLRTIIGGFDNNELKVVVANSTAPTTELVDFTGCPVRGFTFQVSLPNTDQRNRTVIYHAGNGTQQATGYLRNSTIDCSDISDNRNVISPNLLRQTQNVVFNSNQPFEKRGGRIRQLFTNSVGLGQTPNATTGTILRFALASATTVNNTNGGNYRIWIDGLIQAGSYGTQATATLAFQAQLLIPQSYNGQFGSTSATIVVLDRTISNATPSDPVNRATPYVDIVGLSIDVTFSNGVGSVILTPRTIGTGSNDSIVYNGQAELQADFLINDSVIFQ